MKGFAITMKEVFQKSGQSFNEFIEEMKMLSYEDKKWYHTELIKAGFECSEPVV